MNNRDANSCPECGKFLALHERAKLLSDSGWVKRSKCPKCEKCITFEPKAHFTKLFGMFLLAFSLVLLSLSLFDVVNQKGGLVTFLVMIIIGFVLLIVGSVRSKIVKC